jgi:hypothetical protein
MGVTLPEAAPYLFTWSAPAADSSRNYETGMRETDPAMVLMPDFDALVAQPVQSAVAAQNPFGGPLVEAQDAFTGYGWYDRLSRVEDVVFRVTQGDRTFTISDSKEAPIEAEDGFVEAITLLATIGQAGVLATVECEADVAFAPDQFSCNSVDETRIFVLRGTAMTAQDVADLFENAIFYANEDSDADSYETQQERFRADAAERIIGLLEGDDAALENSIRARLFNHRHLLPEDRTVTIVMSRDRLDIGIAPRATGASAPELA